MKALTDRQRMLLDFIRGFADANGYPPTLREIGAHMGIRSTNGVNDHLNALERKGYLSRRDMKSRGIHLTDRSKSTPAQWLDLVVGKLAAGRAQLRVV